MRSILVSTVLGVVLALAPSLALAQSSPGFVLGQVVSPAQWNAILAGKLDIGALAGVSTTVANAVAVERQRAIGAESSLAPLVSPVFTGSPIAPTATPLTPGNILATTSYTDAAVAAEAAIARLAEQANAVAITNEATTARAKEQANASAAAAAQATANGALPQSQVGQPGGVAPLDITGKVPPADLPIGTAGGVVGVGGDVSPNPVTATGGTAALTEAQRAALSLYAVNFGVKCDGSTDDTATLRVAETAAEAAGKELVLPFGKCNYTGLTIAKPVMIRGQGQAGTTLNLLSGSTAPAIAVSVPASFVAPNAYAAEISIKDVQIRSPSRDDSAGQGVAHGISLVPASDGGAYTRVLLNGVGIGGVPGDGIHGGPAWKGLVESYGTEITYPGGYGINANSVTDWRISGGEVCGALQDGVLLSGTSSFVINNLNVYVNKNADIHIYNSSSTVIQNSTIDITGTYGLYIDNRQANQRVDVIGSKMRWAGTSANATYSDLYLSADNINDVYLTGTEFKAPSTSPNPNQPLWNIMAAPGNTGRVVDEGVSFGGGSAIASVVNTPSILVHADANDLAVGRNATIAGTLTAQGGETLTGNLQQTAAAQYTGHIFLNSLGQAFAKIFGTTTGNDNGVFQLLSGNMIFVQFGASGIANFINGDLYLGNSGSSATPYGAVLRAPDGAGTDIAGASVVMSGGRGTGTGTGGSIQLQTAPRGTTGTAQNAGVTRLTIDANGHVDVGIGSPTLSACGTSPTISGSDNAGLITTGTGATACTLTFAAAYATRPYCTVTGESAAVTYSLAKSAITIAAGANVNIDYQCTGQAGG